MAEVIPMDANGNNQNLQKTQKNLSDIIIQNALLIHNSSKRRYETLFFKLVQGGSVSTIKDVIHKLNTSGNSDYTTLLHWLMGDEYLKQKNELDHCVVFLKMVVKFVLLVAIWIILTPVIYLIHSFINRLVNSKKMCEENFSISVLHRVDMPLVFAVFSGCSEMVDIFLDYGIPITSTDFKGNNVIHYIADLSSHELAQANGCYKMMIDLASSGNISNEDLSYMIRFKRNRDMQTPIEYCFQFGSLELASSMIDDNMTEDILVIDKEAISLSTDTYFTKDKGDITRKESQSSTVWTEKRLDVSTYSDKPHHGFVSYLLHILIARPTTTTSAKNWIAIKENKCLQAWMSAKYKQWKPCIIFLAVLDYFITFLIGFGLLQNTQGDMLLYPNRDILIQEHVKIFLNEWRDTVPSNLSQFQLSQSFFSQYSDIQEKLGDDGKRMDYVELLQLIRKLDGYNNFTQNDMHELYSFVCVTSSSYFQVGDLIKMDNCTKDAADSLVESCTQDGSKYTSYFYIETWKPYEFAVATTFQAPIFLNKRSIHKNILNMVITKDEILLMVFIIAIYFAVYIFLDVLCRIISLSQQIISGSSLYSIFASALHGSGVKGQVNVFCGFGYLCLLFYYWSSLQQFYSTSTTTNDLQNEILSYDRLSEDNIRTNFVMATILAFMMVSRITLHLHTLKLLPWIGSFVVTTFQMAFDLLQFAIVYVIMLILFSLLFHFISRDPDCPVFRNPDNYDVLDSMFTTFAFAFGHVDIEFENASLKIAYVIYVVMGLILLLNLIIAVMSATASCVTVEPWCSQLYNEGLLMEAIGIEHWCFTLLPFKKFIKYSYKRGGFSVEETNGKLKVFVDVFSNCKTDVYPQ